MKTIIKATGLTAIALRLSGRLWAQNNIAGTWKSQFDSQIGTQKYTFVLKVDGTNLTGRAIGNRDTGTNDVAITNGQD